MTDLLFIGYLSLSALLIVGLLAVIPGWLPQRWQGRVVPVVGGIGLVWLVASVVVVTEL